MSRFTVEKEQSVEVAEVALFDEGEEQVVLANLLDLADGLGAAISRADMARAREICLTMRNVLLRERARAAEEMNELARAAQVSGYPYVHPEFVDCSQSEKELV